MNALILTPDYAPQGIYTIPRGEGRWTFNMAELFALAGYEVDIIGFPHNPILPEYKEKQPVGINWLTRTLDETVALDKQYDVYFCHFPIHIENKTIWHKVKQVTKKQLLGTWWPQAAIEWPTKWGEELPESAKIVTPFRALYDLKGNTLVHAIPLGHVDTLGASAFHKKKIVWTCKRPLTNDRGNEKFRTNLYHLEATLKAAEQDYEVDIMCGGNDFIMNTPDAPPVDPSMFGMALELKDKLSRLSNVKFYDYMPLDKFTDHIKSGSITIPLDCSSAIPHTILYGQVPLLFTDWGMEFTRRETLIKLDANKNYGEYTREEVHNKFFRLLEDEVYYNKQLNIIRTECPCFTTQQALINLQYTIESINGR